MDRGRRLFSGFEYRKNHEISKAQENGMVGKSTRRILDSGASFALNHSKDKISPNKVLCQIQEGQGCFEIWGTGQRIEREM